ncbi:TolC family protein [Chitinispirillales bacterium ANBcel5]|uniref:TolC family protein n=1 Tax=Cellulosispirillum alkaliphilum TaxID=3039283 RepID=UPI002A575D58|nr:TolC family protein [Chitinispirillales bacterium ANBcel5]
MSYLSNPLKLVSLCCCLILPGSSDTLTLRNAERAALENNLNFLSAQYELSATRWERNSAIGNIFPTVSFSTTYITTEDIAEEPPAPVAQQQPTVPTGPGIVGDGFSHQLSVTQPLFNGGVEVASLLVARKTLSAMEHTLEATRQDVILEVRSNYLNTLVAFEQLRIDSTGLAWVEQNLKQARVSEERGVMPASEVLRWEAELLERQVRINESHTAARLALSQLLLSIGETQVGEADVQLEGMELLKQLYRDTAEIIDNGVGRNPSILAAEDELEVAQRSVLVSITQFLPRINAFFQYDWPPENGVIVEQESYWTMGAQASIDLFAGGRRYSELQMSRYQARMAETMTQQMRRQTQISLENARDLYRNSGIEVEASSKRLQLMQEALSMVERRYRAGMAGLIELLDTQMQLEAAQVAYLGAMAGSILNRAEYLRAAGMLEELQ